MTKSMIDYKAKEKELEMLIQREESSKKVKAERDRLRYLLEEAKIETINQDKLLQQAKSIEE